MKEDNIKQFDIVSSGDTTVDNDIIAEIVDEIDVKNKILKIIKFYYDITLYMEYEFDEGSKRFYVTKIMDNEYGNMLVNKFGISDNEGWYIRQINNDKVINKDIGYINVIMNRIKVSKGYEVYFKTKKNKLKNKKQIKFTNTPANELSQSKSYSIIDIDKEKSLSKKNNYKQNNDNINKKNKKILKIIDIDNDRYKEIRFYFPLELYMKWDAQDLDNKGIRMVIKSIKTNEYGNELSKLECFNECHEWYIYAINDIKMKQKTKKDINIFLMDLHKFNVIFRRRKQRNISASFINVKEFKKDTKLKNRTNNIDNNDNDINEKTNMMNINESDIIIEEKENEFDNIRDRSDSNKKNGFFNCCKKNRNKQKIKMNDDDDE